MRTILKTIGATLAIVAVIAITSAASLARRLFALRRIRPRRLRVLRSGRIRPRRLRVLMTPAASLSKATL
jgi:hypothetical protein